MRPDVLSDSDDVVIVDQDLRHIIDVNQSVPVHSEIGGQDDLSLLQGLADKLCQDGLIEDVISHKQHEGLVKSFPSFEKGASVTQVPVRIPDRGDSYTSAAAQVRQERLDALGFVAGNHVEIGNAGLLGGRDTPLNERQPGDGDKRFAVGYLGHPATIARSQDQALHAFHLPSRMGIREESAAMSRLGRPQRPRSPTNSQNGQR